MRPRSAAVCAGFAVAGGLLVVAAPAGSPAAERLQPTRQEFAVSARRYAFEPARLQVRQDDIVKVAFSASDIPHSFTVDAYRIAKRANPGQTVVFEFHADRTGTFPIYCNLTMDERCREMHGELIVSAK